MPDALPHTREERARRLRCSAVKRRPHWLDLPTAAEARSLPGFQAATWRFQMTPAGTPAEIVETVGAAIRTALVTEQGAAPFGAVGGPPPPRTPRDFAAVLAAKADRSGGAGRCARVTIE